MSYSRIPNNLPSSTWKKSHTYGVINTPRLARARISLPKVCTSSINQVQANKGSIKMIVRPEITDAITTSQMFQHSCDPNNKSKDTTQLYAILKAVAESVEMHKNTSKQQKNCNSTLLSSINIMMIHLNTAIHNTALKATSILLMISAKGVLLIKNKIQASQRNAITLFKKLHTNITNKNQMKFLKSMKETNNGWSPELENEMRDILEVVKRKEMEEYERRGNLALKITKTFAILGPLLTAIAAIGSAFARHGSSWAGIVAAVAGSLADCMKALEGMVLEMCRNCGGLFKLIENTIEATLEEKDYEKRENGEIFEMKVARKMGRSVSQLRRLASKFVAYDTEGISIDELPSS